MIRAREGERETTSIFPCQLKNEEEGWVSERGKLGLCSAHVFGVLILRGGGVSHQPLENLLSGWEGSGGDEDKV